MRMLYSMTGFGKAEAMVDDISIQIEIRTLNSKGLDLNIRMPHFLKHKELQIRNLLSQELKRGKVDAYFTLDLPANLQANLINQKVINAYMKQINELASSHNLSLSNDLDTLLKLPNVLSATEQEIEEETWQKIEDLLSQACQRVVEFRTKEGGDMEIILREAIATIAHHLEQIPQYEQERVEKVRERINTGLQNIASQQDIDQNRLEQELIFYIEKFDITEEKVRLAAHLAHFLELADDDQAQAKGKKLNFISQEIGREINTIGSKANHLEIQKHVVNMKDQLEQIKEQLSNIL